MKLTIEPTSTVDTIEGVPCRLWTGQDERATPVHVWVRTLTPQTHDPALLEPFERDLAALPPVEAQVMIRDFRFVVS